jgi:CheY-like chemotaxis protein
MVIIQALEDAGFDVLEAEHADAALQVLDIHAARTHVLFPDIHMPGTSGNSVSRARSAANSASFRSLSFVPSSGARYGLLG